MSDRKKLLDTEAASLADLLVPDEATGARWVSVRDDIHATLERVYSEAKRAGRREEATAWAWWRDGTQYVGCGMYTLRQALALIQDGEQ